MWEVPAHGSCYHVCAGGPEFYYKAGWASQGKWVSKENSSMASESTSASMFQPCLSFCSGFLQWCSIFWRHKLNKLSSPQLVFGGSISLQHEKPEHYNTKLCSHCYFPLPLRTLEYLLKGRKQVGPATWNSLGRSLMDVSLLIYFPIIIEFSPNTGFIWSQGHS